MARRRRPPLCQWVTLQEALNAFALNLTGHQGAEHIKPLHWYVASRLVVEGGFHPDDITPRPPFQVTTRGERVLLDHDATLGRSGERTILGGLKTKDVDVVVVREGIGPVIAVSMKGTFGAFRNLTNRMEEAVGDCTNLHISYPALVYGFLHVLRGNRETPDRDANNVAMTQNGAIVESIVRYLEVLTRLAGRDDVRDVTTKYESVALCLANPDTPNTGELITTFPPHGSPLHFSRFFDQLYRQYDLRFVYAAPSLKTTTRRLVWDPESPALADPRLVGYQARVG